jgi:hypothetical protein
MIDKEVILHLIDGPGAGWTWIALGFFATIVFLTMIRFMHNDDAAFRRGQEAQRYDSVEQLKTSMAKLVFDQQQILSKVEDKEKTYG